MGKTYPDAIAHYPPSMQLFIRKIHNRIESGKNALIAVVGGTGSGKSWSTMSIMIALDLYRYGKKKEDDYYIEHCIFRAKDLMKGLNNPDLKKKTNWQWDEAGIDAGSQEHQTTKNKVIGWLGQTFRNLQQVVFFTLPTLGMLTPQVRKLLHFYLEALSVDKSTDECTMKPLEMQYNVRMDKIYYHNLKMMDKDGYIQECEFIRVPKAPQELLDKYEAKKSEFTTDLNLQIQGALERIEEKEKKNNEPKERKPFHKLTEYQQAIWKAYTEKGLNTNKKLAEELGITPSHISKNLQPMANKGYYLELVKEKPTFGKKNVSFEVITSKQPAPTLNLQTHPSKINEMSSEKGSE